LRKISFVRLLVPTIAIAALVGTVVPASAATTAPMRSAAAPDSAASVSLANAPAPAGQPTGGLWVLRSPSETALQAIADSGATDAPYRAKAQAKVKQWLSSAAAGKTVTVPGVNDAPLAAGTADLTTLSRQLAAGAAATTPEVAVAAPNSAAPLDVNGNDPNSFSVRGEPGSGNLYWVDLQVAYEADYCTDACVDMDKIVSTVTIDPGATTTRISNSSIYSPNHGDFANKHLEGWAINKGNLVGNDNSTNIPGAPPFYVGNSRPLNGTVLTTAVTLWVYFIPEGDYIAGDGAQTHDATCEAASTGNACRY
jgi:hypothetical protein